MTRGSIYQIRNKTSGKCYIGQTQNTKVRDGIPYKYGISGRWSDHVSTAFRSYKTPLSKAIFEYGADDFDLTVLESEVPEEMLDEREAHWIAHNNTTIPNGYNVMRHSRCKHRENSTLADHYLPTTCRVRIAPIKHRGIDKLVYVYLDQTVGEAVRLTFGQGSEATYEDALDDAQDFAAHFAEFGIEVREEISDDPLRKYREKIDLLYDKLVERIRIAKFNHLVALYIKHNEGTTRICFGGKTIKLKDAYETALKVKNIILETHESVIIQDDLSESATGGRL
jgi:hypothetical protein